MSSNSNPAGTGGSPPADREAARAGGSPRAPVTSTLSPTQEQHPLQGITRSSGHSESLSSSKTAEQLRKEFQEQVRKTSHEAQRPECSTSWPQQHRAQPPIGQALGGRPPPLWPGHLHAPVNPPPRHFDFQGRFVAGAMPAPVDHSKPLLPEPIAPPQQVEESTNDAAVGADIYGPPVEAMARLTLGANESDNPAEHGNRPSRQRHYQELVEDPSARHAVEQYRAACAAQIVEMTPEGHADLSGLVPGENTGDRDPEINEDPAEEQDEHHATRDVGDMSIREIREDADKGRTRASWGAEPLCATPSGQLCKFHSAAAGVAETHKPEVDAGPTMKQDEHTDAREVEGAVETRADEGCADDVALRETVRHVCEEELASAIDAAYAAYGREASDRGPEVGADLANAQDGHNGGREVGAGGDEANSNEDRFGASRVAEAAVETPRRLHSRIHLVPEYELDSDSDSEVMPELVAAQVEQNGVCEDGDVDNDPQADENPDANICQASDSVHVSCDEASPEISKRQLNGDEHRKMFRQTILQRQREEKRSPAERFDDMLEALEEGCSRDMARHRVASWNEEVETATNPSWFKPPLEAQNMDKVEQKGEAKDEEANEDNEKELKGSEQQPGTHAQESVVKLYDTSHTLRDQYDLNDANRKIHMWQCEDHSEAAESLEGMSAAPSEDAEELSSVELRAMMDRIDHAIASEDQRNAATRKICHQLVHPASEARQFPLAGNNTRRPESSDQKISQSVGMAAGGAAVTHVNTDRHTEGPPRDAESDDKDSDCKRRAAMNSTRGSVWKDIPLSDDQNVEQCIYCEHDPCSCNNPSSSEQRTRTATPPSEKESDTSGSMISSHESADPAWATSRGFTTGEGISSNMRPFNYFDHMNEAMERGDIPPRRHSKETTPATNGIHKPVTVQGDAGMPQRPTVVIKVPEESITTNPAQRALQALRLRPDTHTQPGEGPYTPAPSAPTRLEDSPYAKSDDNKSTSELDCPESSSPLTLAEITEPTEATPLMQSTSRQSNPELPTAADHILAESRSCLPEPPRPVGRGAFARQFRRIASETNELGTLVREATVQAYQAPGVQSARRTARQTARAVVDEARAIWQGDSAVSDRLFQAGMAGAAAVIGVGEAVNDAIGEGRMAEQVRQGVRTVVRSVSGEPTGSPSEPVNMGPDHFGELGLDEESHPFVDAVHLTRPTGEQENDGGEETGEDWELVEG